VNASRERSTATQQSNHQLKESFMNIDRILALIAAGLISTFIFVAIANSMT